MPNTGVRPGLNADGWRTYRPKLQAFVATGTAVQPVLGNAGVFGKWARLRSGLVACQGQITFGSTTTFGDGDVWGVSLPIMGHRWQGGADLPIGTAWAGKGSTPYLNLTVPPTLMDPLPPGGQQTQEDAWAQFFVSQSISVGTATITGTALTAVVTHNIGGTPNAEDINLVMTAPTGVPANSQSVFITAITTTTFTINVRTAPGGVTAHNFAWKIRGEPGTTGYFPQLLNYQRPWFWASGDTLAWSFEYEARQ